MNASMADGARERLVAQMGEALFGQPGLTLMELVEKVKASHCGGCHREIEASVLTGTACRCAVSCSTAHQVDELRAAARVFHNTVALKAVVCDLADLVIGWDAVVAAGARLRLALLNQNATAVVSDSLQPIPATAARTRVVQSEAVNGGLDLVESSESPMAMCALEHGPGVRPNHDGEVTNG
nr:hypothetical protein [Stenotrophomonas pavanii]